MIDGLTKFGLEAVRVYLCEADYIYTEIGGKLKKLPRVIQQNI